MNKFALPRFSKFSALLLLSAALLALWLVRAYIPAGFPYTHDGENHLVRFMNYAAAVREGQWPPRFAPYLLSGYGFPVFEYNYPLANILSVPWVWLGVHPGQIFALLSWTFIFGGTVATWSIVRQQFSRSASVFAGGWYVTSSYLTTTLFYRGNIGEILAYGLVPITIVCIQKALHSSSRAWQLAAVFVLAAFLLVHNVIAVMMVPWGILWGLSLAWEQKKLRRFVSICAMSVLLSVWFWIPALAELHLIVLQSDSLAQDAVKHTLTFSQLFFTPLRFGFSRPDTLDSLSMSLGWGTFLLSIGIAAAVLQAISYRWLKTRTYHFTQSLKNHSQRTLLIHLCMVTTALFLTSDVSVWLWRLVPQLSLLQFPWRFLFIVSLAIVPLAAWLFDRLTWKWQFLLWSALLGQLLWIIPVQVVDRAQKSPEYYLSAPHTTTTRNENRPVTLPSMDLPSWNPTPTITAGEGSITEIRLWKGSVRQYSVLANTDITVTEPTVFFPGWAVMVEGVSPAPTAFANDTGLYSYTLAARPEAPYKVTSRFGHRTPARLVGEWLSILSLVTIAVWWLYPFLYKHKNRVKIRSL